MNSGGDGFVRRPEGAYRGEVPRCPACGDALEATPAGAAEIDVCPRCGGLWFDWTDGDLASLARKTTRETVGAHGAPGDAAGDGACPRCRDPLGDDTVRGIKVARCGACAGAFVTRAAAEQIVAAHPAPEGPRHIAFLDRVATWVEDVIHPTRALLRDAGLAPDAGDGGPTRKDG
jgi:Zn-finger nucleic acid-binding protein